MLTLFHTNPDTKPTLQKSLLAIAPGYTPQFVDGHNIIRQTRSTTAQQGVWQNTGRRKPCFIVQFIVHLHIQLVIKKLAEEYNLIIFFTQLRLAGLDGTQNTRTSPSSAR